MRIHGNLLAKVLKRFRGARGRGGRPNLIVGKVKTKIKSQLILLFFSGRVKIQFIK
jgi:hypothetical protein